MQANDSTRIIRPPRGFVNINFSELWRYRELFFFLAWRDIIVHYKQAVIGIAWTVIRPFFTMVVFTVIFGMLAKFPSDGVPYTVLTFTAILPWQFCANVLNQSSASIIGNAGMISKIYFPRLIIPLSTVLSTTFDFLIAFAILIGLLAWYKIAPAMNVLFLPLFFLLGVCFALGLGLWMAALNVKYRDVKHVMPFVVQMGLYLSPVGFSSNIIPEKYRFVYSLNPMVGVIDGFRWCLLRGHAQTQIYWPGLWLSVAITVVIFIAGLYYFRNMESTFADII